MPNRTRYDNTDIAPRADQVAAPKGSIFDEISVTQLAAGAMAAVVSLLLSSRIGIAGSVIGAFILTLIAAVMQSYPEYRMIVYALLLIILMLYRPNGILGNKELAELMLSKWKKGGRGDGPVAENK